MLGIHAVYTTEHEHSPWGFQGQPESVGRGPDSFQQRWSPKGETGSRQDSRTPCADSSRMSHLDYFSSSFCLLPCRTPWTRCTRIYIIFSLPFRVLKKVGKPENKKSLRTQGLQMEKAHLESMKTTNGNIFVCVAKGRQTERC